MRREAHGTAATDRARERWPDSLRQPRRRRGRRDRGPRGRPRRGLVFGPDLHACGDPRGLEVVEAADVAAIDDRVHCDALLLDDDALDGDAAVTRQALADDVLGGAEVLARMRPLDAGLLVELRGDRRIVPARDGAPEPLDGIQEVTSAGHPAPPL